MRAKSTPPMEICVPMAKTCGGMPTLTGITAVLLVRSCSHRCGVLRIVRPSFLVRPDPADLLPHLPGQMVTPERPDLLHHRCVQGGDDRLQSGRPYPAHHLAGPGPRRPGDRNLFNLIADIAYASLDPRIRYA